MWGPLLDFHTSFKTKDIYKEKQNIIHLGTQHVSRIALIIFKLQG